MRQRKNKRRNRIRRGTLRAGLALVLAMVTAVGAGGSLLGLHQTAGENGNPIGTGQTDEGALRGNLVPSVVQASETEEVIIDFYEGNAGSGAGDASSDKASSADRDGTGFIQGIEVLDSEEIPAGITGGPGAAGSAGTAAEILPEGSAGTPEKSGLLSGTESDAGTGTGTSSGSEVGAGAEPGTSSGAEADTEPDTEPDTKPEPESGTGDEAGQNETETRIYLGIDNLHRYEGMEQSFSDGYSPLVQNGTLKLVVPYVASGKLKDDKLTVDLEFSRQQEIPCELNNYQKDVNKKVYRPVNGVMQEDYSAASVSGDGNTAGANLAADGVGADWDYVEAYLYQCQIPVLASVEPGQYSVTVKAWGYSERMELVKLDYQIFFRIPEPDPVTAPKQTAKKTGGSGSGSTGSGYGGGGSSGGGESAEEIIRQPKMLLESCNLTGKELEAGGQEQLKVSLQNRSQSQTMYNLKVVLQAESTALTLERNSFYFEKVQPEESIDIEETIGVAQNAEAGVIPVSFTFEYEDKKGTAATGTETMNLTVVQPVKMELEKAEIPVQVYASDTIAVPVSVLNLSRTEVYNARVHLEGAGLFPTGDVFLGNMEAGSSGDGSMNIYVGTRTMEAIGTDSSTEDSEKYGPVSGTITLAYEDASGETHEISQEYQTEIKKAQILFLEVEEEAQEGNSWWVSVFAVALLGMAVLIILLLVRLRRKSTLLEEVRKAGAYAGN